MDHNALQEVLHLSVYKSKSVFTHKHIDIELVYVFSDSLKVVIDHEPIVLYSGDIFIINSLCEHYFVPAENVLYATINITYEPFCRSLYLEKSLMSDGIFAIEDSVQAEIRKTLNQILWHFSHPNQRNCDYAYQACCFHLLDLLSSKCCISKSKYDFSEKTDVKTRIEQIDDYLYSHFHENISIVDLSERFYLSVGYLSRFFKKYFNQSFSDYIGKMRVNQAMSDLIHTTKSVTQIAFDCGFVSEASMNGAKIILWNSVS